MILSADSYFRPSSPRLDSALPILEKNFTLLAPNPKEEKFPLIADGSDAFLSYASGRRGTLGMHTTISLASSNFSFLQFRLKANDNLVSTCYFFRSLDMTPSP